MSGGHGPAPKDPEQRRNKAAPIRGEWQEPDEYGWRHGEVPPLPVGVKRTGTKRAWSVWFGSWFAAFWTPDDLPGLELIAHLYDDVLRGDRRAATELRQMMDNYGITPKGQQDRRWRRPRAVPDAPTDSELGDSPYDHLRPVKPRTG